MVDYFMVYSCKYDRWVPIGAWTAIRMNAVYFMYRYPFMDNDAC